MEITFPKYFESILKQYLKSTFYPSTRREIFRDREFGPKDLIFFAQGAKILSDFFTSERADRPPNYLSDKKLRAGYLLYFLPLNFCKVQAVLGKLPASFFQKEKLKILDLGCGPGTASLAFVDSLARQDKNKRYEVEILALDQNYHILKDAQALLEEMQKNLKAKGYSIKIIFQARTFDLRRGKPDTLLKNDQYDLIIASNFLNEWSSTEASSEKGKFIEKICQRHLSSEGFLILMEPAYQRATRELMALRDLLVKRRGFHLFAPCLHQQACPMLAAGNRDWCHFYFSWEEPEFMKKLDKILKNKNDFLKNSYMIFHPKKVSKIDQIPIVQERNKVYRVISNLMGSRGKAELVLCGPAGRWHVTRLDRHTSLKNKVFADLRRGDLVYVPKISSSSFRQEGDLRIEKEDVIEKIG